ncbi:MAG: hypothetical protein ISR47_03005 [Rhodospirillales bacterium]|nr:hypothetical protein [Rhodospirillales bacterium]
MVLSLSDSRTFRRRQKRRRVAVWLMFLCGLIVLGWAFYQSGGAVAGMEVSELQDQVNDLRAALDDSARHKARLEVQNRQLEGERDEWRQRYRDEVPTKRESELFALLQKQIDNDVSADRLRLMMDAAGEKPSCEGKPTTKRFFVRTPLYKGSDDAVDFSDGAMTVSAKGDSATDSAGNPEAWFDPAKTVSAAFTALGGRTTTAAGRLPLHHAMIAGRNEFRFSIKAGERRGFVEVTADRCEMP